MKIISNIKREPVPAGKRTVRDTRYGNTNAYVGGRRWLTLGPTYAVGTEQRAINWLAGRDPDDDGIEEFEKGSRVIPPLLERLMDAYAAGYRPHAATVRPRRAPQQRS